MTVNGTLVHSKLQTRVRALLFAAIWAPDARVQATTHTPRVLPAALIFSQSLANTPQTLEPIFQAIEQALAA